MNTPMKMSLSDIRTMILCEFPLSTEEFDIYLIKIWNV